MDTKTFKVSSEVSEEVWRKLEEVKSLCDLPTFKSVLEEAMSLFMSAIYAKKSNHLVGFQDQVTGEFTPHESPALQKVAVHTAQVLAFPAPKDLP